MNSTPAATRPPDPTVRLVDDSLNSIDEDGGASGRSAGTSSTPVSVWSATIPPATNSTRRTGGTEVNRAGGSTTDEPVNEKRCTAPFASTTIMLAPSGARAAARTDDAVHARASPRPVRAFHAAVRCQSQAF